MPEIKAVIFDLGGVVVYDATSEIIIEALKKFGGRIRVRQVLSALRSKHFQYSKIFYENIEPLQRGEIDELTFWRNVLRLLPGSITSKEAQEVFEKPYRKHFRINRRMLALVDELRNGGFKVVALTNTIPSHFRITRQAIGKHFNAMVASSSIGFSKPQEEAYLYSANAAGVKPEECLVTDDRQRYVDGAKAAGLQAELFRNEKQLRLAFARRGVVLKPRLPFKARLRARASKIIRVRRGFRK